MELPTVQKEDPREHARRIRRDWYMKNREEHKARALERYYENQEENKARNRLRAQQRKARLEELERENAALKSQLDSRESNTDTHISDLVCV